MRRDAIPRRADSDKTMSNWNRSNLGRADRAIRALLGAVALTLVFSGPRTPWGYLGMVLLATAAVGFCPIYATLGLSSKARRTS